MMRLDDAWRLGVAEPAKVLAYNLTKNRRGTPVAMHGIQRSGTNYLETVFRRLRVWPVNRVVRYERHQPRFKHFRWYADKDAVPPFIRHEYLNDTVVADIDGLNRAAAYPVNCSHIVMHKDRTSWLASACNWGIRVDWFRDEEEALSQLPALARDHDAYYDFWRCMAAQSPERVTILNIAELTRDFSLLLDGLDRMGVRYRCPPGFDGRIGTVKLSPPDRQKSVSTETVIARMRDAGLETA